MRFLLHWLGYSAGRLTFNIPEAKPLALQNDSSCAQRSRLDFYSLSNSVADIIQSV